MRSFAENNLEPAENVLASQQERNFLDQPPGDADSDADAAQREQDGPDQVRNAPAGNASNLLNAVPGSLTKPQRFSRSQRDHREVGSGINIHDRFEGLTPICQNHFSNRAPNKSVQRAF